MYSLVGNPNVGKTVLFNHLTKSNERVGNWHGVTVSEKKKEIIFGGKKEIFVDLPGCYNLTGYSIEEKVTAKALEKSQKIINICSLESLERNLYLTLLLIEKGYNIVLFINKFGRQKTELNFKKLKELLGVDIIVDSAKNVSNDKLINVDFHQGKLDYFDSRFDSLAFDQKVVIRYKYIERLLAKCKLIKKEKKFSIDKLFLSPIFSLPIFAIIVALMFFICFGYVGDTLSSLLSRLIDLIIKNPITNLIRKLNAGEFVYSLVIDGILEAFVGIISFLPQILLVSICINILEDSGYLARIAFMFEGLLSFVGLSGKSIFSLLVSFGCNTTAMITTSSQEDEPSRKKLSMLLPFVCCSAKLPIFVIFTKILSKNLGFLYVILLYSLTLFVGLFVTYLSNKFFIKSNKKCLILELPDYHVPSTKKCLKSSLDTAKNFFIKIGTTIFLVNICVWFLRNFNFSFRLDSDNSILKNICKIFAPIFAPIGLNNWAIVCALFVGIMAKELVLTTLALTSGINAKDIMLCMSGGLEAYFSPLTLFIFILFVSLYSPCISTLSSMSKTIGKKYAVYSFLINTGIAYLTCSVVYMLGLLARKSIAWLIVVIVIMLVTISVAFLRGCSGCKNCKYKNCPKNTK